MLIICMFNVPNGTLCKYSNFILFFFQLKVYLSTMSSIAKPVMPHTFSGGMPSASNFILCIT